eukprot:scaffold20734_cov82-Skeletonema_dohrnii-CCMP3373.AAC.3
MMKANQSGEHKRDIILGYRDSQDWDRDCTEEDLEKIDQKIADYYKQKELNAVHSLEHAKRNVVEEDARLLLELKEGKVAKKQRHQ